LIQKPKIVWLVDVPDWAYYNRATAISAKLDDYEHFVLSVGGMSKDMFWQLMGNIKPNIIVVMHPSGFQTFNDLGQIVFIATGTRAMTFGKRNKAIVYYTNNEIEGSNLDNMVRDKLTESAGDIPIISVSQKPIKFGKNICVGEKPRKHKSIYEQILAGLEELPDDTYVFFAEHDVLYHESHFADAPSESTKRDQVNYNTNCYRCISNGFSRRELPSKALSQCSGLVGTMKSAIKEKHSLLIHSGREGIGGRIEPGAGRGCSWLDINTYESEMPNVDIRHDKNFSQLIKMEIQGETLPHWGDCSKLREKLSV